LEDLGAIAEIEYQLYPNPWHPHTFRSLLGQDRALVLAAADSDGDVVGYAVFWWVLDQGELANLAVTKGHQGRGLGGALLDEVLARAAEMGVESVFLEVRDSNRPARHLYATRGFGEIDVRRGYYQNPKEDARVLMRSLDVAEPEPGPLPGGRGGGSAEQSRN
jgi:ribosomal-protein-alanine N-acetyltransferase